MVFDTTSSNTGAELGACKFVEDWCKSPILWLACRHHCAELHMMRMVHTVTGNTKDPVVAIFRRLKRDWSGLQIDLENLVTFDTRAPDWLQTPASLWNLFEEFRTLQKFSTNLSVCNDIAERGIHLMSDFIPHCESEDQYQALFQCVEFHRNLVSDCTKKSLKLC